MVSSPTFASKYPRKQASNADVPFLVLGGYSDILLSSVYARGHGCITGLANLFPVRVITDILLTRKTSLTILNSQYTLAKLGTTTFSSYSSDTSMLEKAQQLQGLVARADYTMARTGIAGAKAILAKFQGYGGNPRRPLLPFGEAEADKLWKCEEVQEMAKLEREAISQLDVA